MTGPAYQESIMKRLKAMRKVCAQGGGQGGAGARLILDSKATRREQKEVAGVHAHVVLRGVRVVLVSCACKQYGTTAGAHRKMLDSRRVQEEDAVLSSGHLSYAPLESFSTSIVCTKTSTAPAARSGASRLRSMPVSVFSMRRIIP